MEDLWQEVEEATRSARLIAWDGCHKIYLAMDKAQAEWFRENYAPDIFTGTAEEMNTQAREWFDKSCCLRFVEACYSVNKKDPDNARFVRLVHQGDM